LSDSDTSWLQVLSAQPSGQRVRGSTGAWGPNLALTIASCYSSLLSVQVGAVCVTQPRWRLANRVGTALYWWVELFSRLHTYWDNFAFHGVAAVNCASSSAMKHPSRTCSRTGTAVCWRSGVQTQCTCGSLWYPSRTCSRLHIGTVGLLYSWRAGAVERRSGQFSNETRFSHLLAPARELRSLPAVPGVRAAANCGSVPV
jgi:hypothetical protein